MSPITSFAIFFVMWWIVLFMVLPFGVRGQWEEQGGEEGTEPGAPIESNVVKKFVMTTAITIVLFVIFRLFLAAGVFDFLVGL